MPDKQQITQRNVLAQLQQEVGHFPGDLQPLMSEALRHVPDYWNGAIADQEHDILWGAAIREQICRLAVSHVVTVGLSVSMSQMAESQVRRNLTNLGFRE